MSKDNRYTITFVNEKLETDLHEAIFTNKEKAITMARSLTRGLPKNCSAYVEKFNGNDYYGIVFESKGKGLQKMYESYFLRLVYGNGCYVFHGEIIVDGVVVGRKGYVLEPISEKMKKEILSFGNTEIKVETLENTRRGHDGLVREMVYVYDKKIRD